MGIMHSFSYGAYEGINELPSDVLSLFTQLCFDTMNGRVKKIFDYDDKGHPTEIGFTTTMEIVRQGIKGTLNADDFNIYAYDCGIRKNAHKSDRAKKKKFRSLDTMYDYDADSKLPEGSATVEQVVSSIETDTRTSYADQLLHTFDNILDSDELKSAVEFIVEANDIDDEYSVRNQEHIDLIQVMKGAEMGVPDNISVLQRILQEYQMLAEYIKVVMKSGYTLKELFDEHILERA